METRRVQRGLIVRTRIGAGTGATLACGVCKSAVDGIFDSVVVGARLTVHLRNVALPSIIHCDFETARAGAIRRISIPDRLLPATAPTADAVIIGVHKIGIELLIELEVENISERRPGPHVRKSSIRVALERFGEEPARIRIAV